MLVKDIWKHLFLICLDSRFSKNFLRFSKNFGNLTVMKSCHALLGAAKQFHTNYLFVGILPVIGPFFNQTHSPRGRLLSKAWLNIICFHLQRKIFEEVWRLLLWIEFCWAQDFVLLWTESINSFPVEFVVKQKLIQTYSEWILYGLSIDLQREPLKWISNFQLLFNFWPLFLSLQITPSAFSQA